MATGQTETPLGRPLHLDTDAFPPATPPLLLRALAEVIAIFAAIRPASVLPFIAARSSAEPWPSRRRSCSTRAPTPSPDHAAPTRAAGSLRAFRPAEGRPSCSRVKPMYGR
jgi:hypothetical protein